MESWCLASQFVLQSSTVELKLCNNAMIDIQENTATASRNQYRSSARMAAAGSQRLPESALHFPAVFPLQHMGSSKTQSRSHTQYGQEPTLSSINTTKALLSSSCLTKITVTLNNAQTAPKTRSHIKLDADQFRQGYYTVLVRWLMKGRTSETPEAVT